EDGIRAPLVTGVQTCALPISRRGRPAAPPPVGPGGGRDRGPGRGAHRLLSADGGGARRPPHRDRRVARRRAYPCLMAVELDIERSEERRVGKECQWHVERWDK